MNGSTGSADPISIYLSNATMETLEQCVKSD